MVAKGFLSREIRQGQLGSHHLVVAGPSRGDRSARGVAYDGGAKALALLSGEVDVMVSGLGETLAAHRAGTVRILGVTNDRDDMDGMSEFFGARHRRHLL